MQKLLGQDEIDAIVRAARGGAPHKPARNVIGCDFRQAGQLHRDQVAAISGLHETFARNLTHWLAAFLRVGFECIWFPLSPTFNEVAARVPGLAYLSSMVAEPGSSATAMQLELSAAFPIIDLLLGGPGRPGPQRDLTAIEEQILEGICLRIICRELGKAWQPVGLSFEFEERQTPQSFERFMPPNEMTLALSFELRIAESQGALNLVFPAIVSDALLRKLARDWSYHKKPRGSAEAGKSTHHLENCRFTVELALPVIGIPATQLVELHPGSVLELNYPVDGPARVRVAGREIFSAAVARHQQRRAAQIRERLSPSGHSA